MNENQFQQAYLRRAIELIKKIKESKDLIRDSWIAHLEGYLMGGLEIFNQLEEFTKEEKKGI